MKQGQLEHIDLPENYNPRKNIEFWNCSSFLFTVSCNPLFSTGNRFYSTSNRLITRRDRNWWQASPLDEDPIGQRVWIATPDATIDGVSIGSWNEETRTLNVLLSTRDDYIGAKRISVNSIAEIPENFRPGQRIEFWNCSGILCLRQCDPPGQYGKRECPGPQIEWIRASGVPYA